MPEACLPARLVAFSEMRGWEEEEEEVRDQGGLVNQGIDSLWDLAGGGEEGRRAHCRAPQSHVF